MAKTMRIPRPKLRALTIAEIVGIIAVVVALLGYLDSHHDRVSAEKRQQAEAAAQSAKSTFLVKGEIADKGSAIRLVPLHDDQVVQTQTLWFPKDVHADKVETTGQLQADWIADGVRKAADGAKRGRVPVSVQTVYIQDGETRTHQTVYQVTYSLHPRLLQSDQVKIEALSLAKRGVTGDLQTAAEKFWTKP
jgi:hypothetical protein